jgi:hypothetical protein
MKLAVFLLVAVAIGAACFLVGAWLLPMLGVEGMLTQAIPGGVSGAIIAIVYLQMFKRPRGA